MVSMPPPDEESTLQMPGARPELDANLDAREDIEDARLFTELRGRLFGRDASLRVGRYRLVRQLGAGAMGEVQLAHDEQLDRPVAIKFVHPHLASLRWTEGLRREAKALARLAHANVVHVYEVGVHASRVYLVMEYIEGGSLREWIRAESPSWDELLAAYLDAARGLAAAHGAQIVHRDFKPDNVLRGVDGRVAVVDFGLAALDRDADGSLSDEISRTIDGEDDSYSRSGELKGTPAYMPREQFLGRGGERSDQFSLCVAIYEGLWGRRPFPQRTIDEILDDRADWEPLPPPSRRAKRGSDGRRREAPPRWLWPILRRGLDPDPRLRWPSVDALIAAIEARLAGRRRRALALSTGALVLSVGLASGLGVAYFGPAASPAPLATCGALASELDGTWSPATREALGDAYERAARVPGRAWLADSAAPVSASLDRWRARWLDSRRALCKARKGGDPIVVERHAACLEHMRQTTASLVALLVDGEPELLREGPAAVRQLGDPSACAAQARAGGPPPPAPAIADEVAALREQLATIEAERVLGRYTTALTRVETAVSVGSSLDDPALAADLAFAHGRMLLDHDRGGPGLARLETAADLGEASRHDRVVADSWTAMAAHAAAAGEDLERGRRWLRRAEAAIARVGATPLDEARLAFIRGSLDLDADAFEAARAQLDDALARFVELGEIVHASHAAANLGLAALELADEAGARASFEQSLALREQVYGPTHPELGWAAYNLGQLAMRLEDQALAESLLARAVEIWTEAEEPRPRDRARARFVLAQLAIASDEFEAGLDHAQQAAALFEATLSPDAIEHAEVAALVATANYFLARPGPALGAYRRAVAGYAAAHGEDDLYTALFRVGLGWALLADGRASEARAAFTRGRDAIESSGAAPGTSDDARLGLAAVELAEARPERALTRLDAFSTPPASAGDRFVYELLLGLAELRAGAPSSSAAAHLDAAGDRAVALAGFGTQTLAIILDSVDADARERQLLTP